MSVGSLAQEKGRQDRDRNEHSRNGAENCHKPHRPQTWIVGQGKRAETDNLDYYEVTINLKGYPLGYFEVPEVPDWIQPYGKLGIGFAEVELGYLDEVRFLLRFGAGVDFMLSDKFGLYLDGGYSVITQTVKESKESILDGHGQLGLGGLVRF